MSEHSDIEQDYEIALVVRDNLAETFYARPWHPDHRYVKRLQDVLESHLKRGRYWCIAALDNRKLSWVWIFDSGNARTGGRNWGARLKFEGRTVRVEIAGEGDDVITHIIKERTHHGHAT